MKKMMFVMSIALLAIGYVSCSKDDNTVIPPKPEVVDPPAKIVPESEYKKAILKDWVMVKKQFLKEDKSVLEEIDYKKNKKDCSLEKWAFEEEFLTMFTYNKKDCAETPVKMKYSIMAKNFYFFYPDLGGHFVMNHLIILSFTTKELLMRENATYTEADVKSYNYPKGTKHVQFLFERK